MHCYEHPRPAVTVDAAVLREPARGGRVEALLVQRGRPPFAGAWALPGGFVGIDEDLPAAAARELAEETGLRGLSLHQLGAYGRPERDPRGRTISVVYWGWLPAGSGQSPRAGSDAAGTGWFAADALPALAFDHATILADVLARAAAPGAAPDRR